MTNNTCSGNALHGSSQGLVPLQCSFHICLLRYPVPNSWSTVHKYSAKTLQVAGKQINMHECTRPHMYRYIYIYLFIYTNVSHICMYICIYRYIILYTYICININYSNCYGKEWNTPKNLPVEPGDLFACLAASHLDKVLAVLFGFLPEWRTERTLAYFSWLVKWGAYTKQEYETLWTIPILTRNGLEFSFYHAQVVIYDIAFATLH